MYLDKIYLEMYGIKKHHNSTHSDIVLSQASKTLLAIISMLPNLIKIQLPLLHQTSQTSVLVDCASRE